MAEQFPEISSKLGVPTKKSLFERQKAEAEAKKAREKAETAAVYEDFVKSFDDDGEDDGPDRPSRQVGSMGGFGSAMPVAPGKRHFTGSGLKAGPGSLGPAPGAARSGPGSLGYTTPSSGRKRPYDDFQGQRRERGRERGQGMFSYENDRQDSSPAAAFRADEDEDHKTPGEAKAAAKPTLHLSSLPPGTSPAVVKALFTPSPLVIENVRILPSAAPNTSNMQTVERKSTSALVTLASETPATDMDTIVSHLQNKYLGFGFYLSISRHLSSAALSGTSSLTTPTAGTQTLPFGARPIPQMSSLSRAPPPGQAQGRFAPPASYTSSVPYGSRPAGPPTQVTVQTPSDLNQLKLIHKTLEALLTHGPEFEALLMSRPEIQREEKWAFLWDSRSTGGVYYRWRLWDILTDSSNRQKRRRGGGYGMSNTGEALFEGQSLWIPPEQGLKFEYTTSLSEFVSDSDYDSSDEEDDDGGIARRYNDHHRGSAGPPPDAVPDSGDGSGYLNPLSKTKLVHLLARLPDTNAKLRRGDVARVTGFAIEHAGSGASEVAELITMNVIRPFCYSSAAAAAADNPQQQHQAHDEIKDQTAASLVGLYVISDILSCSAAAGVRHAWRYRALFETSLRQQRVFQRLGGAEKELGWGKLKVEKWKRAVQGVLGLWEGWCVFPQATQEEFVRDFVSPPVREGEEDKGKESSRKSERDDGGEEARRVKRNKWRSVEDVEMDDIDGTPRADDSEDGGAKAGDVDGQPMASDEDDENIDGEEMLDSSDNDDDEQIPTRDVAEKNQGESPDQASATAQPAAAFDRRGQLDTSTAKRQRPRAVDMFADDDESEGE